MSNIGKQFTFKTTKSTCWLRDLLESLPSSTRSDFIREMIITGMEHKGYIIWRGRHPVLFMSNMEEEEYETEPPIKETLTHMEPVMSDPPKIEEDKTSPLEKDPIKFLREDPPSDILKDETSPKKSDQNQVEKMDSISPPMPPPMETIVWTAFGEAEELNKKLDSLFEDE